MKGAMFWIVVIAAQPNHLKDVITIGIHWKNGNIPNFMEIDRKYKSLEFMSTEIKIIALPLAWTIKYLTIFSTYIPRNRGIKPNSDISILIQE